MIRPQILSASIVDGELVLIADGAPVIALSPRKALCLIERIARALAQPAAPVAEPPRVPRFPG